MRILSSVQTLKNITGAKNSDKGTTPAPKEPVYTPPSAFENTQVKIYGGNEKYIHAGIEQKVGDNLFVTPNVVVYHDHGLHTGYAGLNVEYKWK